MKTVFCVAEGSSTPLHVKLCRSAFYNLDNKINHIRGFFELIICPFINNVYYEQQFFALIRGKIFSHSFSDWATKHLRHKFIFPEQEGQIFITLTLICDIPPLRTVGAVQSFVLFFVCVSTKFAMLHESV